MVCVVHKDNAFGLRAQEIAVDKEVDEQREEQCVERQSGGGRRHRHITVGALRHVLE